MTSTGHSSDATVGRRTRLGPGREFDLIRSLLDEEAPLPEGVSVGPGDDCLVLAGGLVVSCDLSVEDVHFRRGWLSLEEAGYRTMAAALSDLAAMAASPLGALLSLAVPSDEAEGSAEAIVTGAKSACGRQGTQIVGGDVSRSPGPIAMDVVVLGRSDAPVLRSGSQPGDEVWVTGWLGASAAAVEALTLGKQPSGELMEAFARPRPRIREAIWLARRLEIHSLIDLSDGLGGDSGHLAAASGTRFLLEAERIPVHPALGEGLDPLGEAFRHALTGGEDYELCFTVPPGSLEEEARAFRVEFEIPLTRVGTVEEGEGVAVVSREGDSLPLPQGGFSHFVEGDRS